MSACAAPTDERMHTHAHALLGCTVAASTKHTTSFAAARSRPHNRDRRRRSRQTHTDKKNAQKGIDTVTTPPGSNNQHTHTPNSNRVQQPRGEPELSAINHLSQHCRGLQHKTPTTTLTMAVTEPAATGGGHERWGEGRRGSPHKPTAAGAAD